MVNLNWNNINKEEKIKVIKTVLKEEVLPRLEEDGGGIKFIDLKDNKIIVEYEGACKGCSCAKTFTLDFIRTVFQEKIDSTLDVEINY